MTNSDVKKRSENQIEEKNKHAFLKIKAKFI